MSEAALVVVEGKIIMGSTPESIRKEWTVDRTPRDKGDRLTVRVVVYDKGGLLQVDGVPMDDWDEVHERVSATLDEFRSEVEERRQAS